MLRKFLQVCIMSSPIEREDKTKTHSFEHRNGGHDRVQRGFRHFCHLQHTQQQVARPKRLERSVTKRILAFLLLFRAPNRCICGTVTLRRAARGVAVPSQNGRDDDIVERVYEWGRWRASARLERHRAKSEALTVVSSTLTGVFVLAMAKKFQWIWQIDGKLIAGYENAYGDDLRALPQSRWKSKRHGTATGSCQKNSIMLT